MLQDLRHSVGAMARTKGAAAVILLSLALGTGTNAAVTGIVDALLLRAPDGIEAPSRLVSIYTSDFSGAAYGPSSYADYLSIRSTARSFGAIAVAGECAVENVRLGEAERAARISSISEDFFVALQMDAHVGRLFASADAGQTPLTVLSFSLWEQLGGPAHAVGSTLAVGDREYSIVGVAPPRFRGLRAGQECDAWVLMAPLSGSRGDRRLSVIARLAPRVSIDAAKEELRQISDDLAQRYPDTNRGNLTDDNASRRLAPAPYSPLDPAAGRQIALIGLVAGGASALLLASACLNVGSLLLSSAVARQRDLAIKMALGATRRRLMRQLIVETLCLSLAGGGLGLLFALWTANAVPALFMTEQADMLDTRLDARMILLTAGVAFLAGAVFGGAPAFHATASPAVTALRADAGGVSQHQSGTRLRVMLVGTQIALSIVLLLGTGLLVMSLTRALEGDMGSAVRKVAFVSLELPGRFQDPVRGVAYRKRLLERVPSLHGVESVGWASTLPLGSGNRHAFTIETEKPEVNDSVELDTNVVSPGYFRTLALQCIEGRLFDDGDGALAPPVVIVDELLARRYFGPTATGRHLVDGQGARLKIVGVVRTGRYRTLQPSPQLTVYYPSSQDYLWRGHLLVRTSREPTSLLGALDQTVKEVGGGAAILQTSTLETHLSDVLSLDRLTTTLVGLCGLIALGMSTIGVYGVMADAVQRRSPEIGLRVALGAGPAQVVRMVFLEAAYLAVGGLLAGTAVAAALSHIGRSLVHGLPRLELTTVAAASAALAVVVVGAAFVPMRRALRVSPTVALRAE